MFSGNDIDRIREMEMLFDEVSAVLEYGVPCSAMTEKIRMLRLS